MPQVENTENNTKEASSGTLFRKETDEEERAAVIVSLLASKLRGAFSVAPDEGELNKPLYEELQSRLSVQG